MSSSSSWKFSNFRISGNQELTNYSFFSPSTASQNLDGNKDWRKPREDRVSRAAIAFFLLTLLKELYSFAGSSADCSWCPEGQKCMASVCRLRFMFGSVWCFRLTSTQCSFLVFYDRWLPIDLQFQLKWKRTVNRSCSHSNSFLSYPI